MKRSTITGLLLCSLFFVVGGDAQSPSTTETTVWTLEFIKVRPEKFGLTLGYMDDHWMRVREEAKRQGTVLSYHRISSALLITPGSKSGDQNSIVLLTEYKNLAAFVGRKKLFASIIEHLPSKTPGVLPAAKEEDLFQTVDMRVFLDVPAEASTQFKLLAKQ